MLKNLNAASPHVEATFSLHLSLPTRPIGYMFISPWNIISDLEYG